MPCPNHERDVPLPSPKDPELENHPIIKAALLIIEVHSDTLRRIGEGFRYTRKNEETGEIEDTTDEIKELSLHNLEQARKLIEEVRECGVFTSVAAEIIREMDIPATEKAPENLPVSAEEATEHPEEIIHLPGER